MYNTQLKEELEMTMKAYTNRTGIEVRYEHQPGNGNWLWFGSHHNNGLGLYVGVDGRREALRTLEGLELEN